MPACGARHEPRPDTAIRTSARDILKLLSPARLAGIFVLSFIVLLLLVRARALSWPTFALTPLIIALAAIIVLDLAARIIPDLVTLPMLVYALLLAATNVTIPLLQAVLGAVVGGGFPLIMAMISRGAVGGGDVKLMAVLGAVLGWKGALYVFALSHIAGALVLLVRFVIHRRFPRGRFPIGALIAMVGALLIAAGR
jgi:leader peptidase (prepilin peptidase) / N-methyltransferase